MALSRSDKMLAALGIRLQKDPRSEWRVILNEKLLHQESIRKISEEGPVDSLETISHDNSELLYSEVNKENKSQEDIKLDSCNSIESSFVRLDTSGILTEKNKDSMVSKLTATIPEPSTTGLCLRTEEEHNINQDNLPTETCKSDDSDVHTYAIASNVQYPISSEIVSNRETAVPALHTVSQCKDYPGCSKQRSSSSSSNSSSSSDSSESNCHSDFSSDDSVKDPNYNEDLSSSPSSDSETEHIQTITGPDTKHVPLESDTRHKSRKRKRNPSTWTKNCIKRLRNSGKGYKTYKNKQDVTARSIKPPCDIAKCKQKCTTKFSDQERKALFENYWAMGDINKQRTYIVTLMEDVKRTQEKNRVNNHAFYFMKNQTKIRVCKPFFVSTLGITNRCIRTVISKTLDGSLGEDLRGKHENHKTVSQDIKNGIKSHISSIPTIESHYVRAHSEKVYIEGGKTIAQLYRDYKSDRQKENKPFAKFSMYRDIFNHEFNIAFFTPKKDQCQTCVSYQNSSNGEKRKVEEEYQRHQEEKSLSREEKNKDKNLISSDYKVACFDLQAALPTPRGQVSSFYYKSKLSTYNFTVCELEKKGQGSVYCFMWHEGEGKRGATEIGTCLLDFLKETAEKANSQNLEIVLYSDNCAGQQKNKFILAAFLYAVANYKIKSISHKYLVTGHTQNEGDNVHSLIEKNIKRALKSGPIYTPAQYVTLVQTAKKTGTPYKVIEFTHEDFVDLKKLTEKTVLNCSINPKGENFKFGDISVLKVEKEHTDMFFYKTSFKDADFKEVHITKQRRTRNPITPLLGFEGYNLETAYAEKIPISKNKYEDLMFLVRSNAIIKNHSDFYRNLPFINK